MNPTPQHVNTGRTHASSELAFRGHCDYACALVRPPRRRLDVDGCVALFAAACVAAAALALWLS